jgi:hypothetical protein
MARRQCITTRVNESLASGSAGGVFANCFNKHSRTTTTTTVVVVVVVGRDR